MSASLCLIAWKRSDRTPEGETLLRILAGHLQAGIGPADLFEREQDRRAVQDSLHGTPAAGPKRLNGYHVEIQPSVIARWIEGFQVPPAHIRQIGDEQTGLPVLIACDHDGDIGDAAIRHGPFRACQPPAHDAGVDRGRLGVAVAFRQRQAADQRSIRQFWKIFAALRVRSRGQDRFRRQIGRGAKWHRRDRSAHLLGQHAQAFVTQASTAEGLGDRGADPSHAGDLPPQICGVCLLTIKRSPHHGGGATLGEEPP